MVFRSIFNDVTMTAHLNVLANFLIFSHITILIIFRFMATFREISTLPINSTFTI